MSKQPSSSDFAVSFIPPPASGPISFSSDEVREGAKHWDLSLVGYAAGRRPTYLSLLAAIKRIWKPKGNLELLTLDEGFFLFKFSCIEDYQHAWENGPWYILNRPFILKKWRPGLTLSKDDLSSIPIWCNLAKIPLECYNENGISKIASKIGKPLVVDKLTASKSRVNFARVCVEILADSPLHDAIDVLIDELPVSIHVHYDWTPPACSLCKTFEHSNTNCPSAKAPTTETPAPTNGRGRSRSRRRNPVGQWKEKTLPIIVAPPPLLLPSNVPQDLPATSATAPQPTKILNLNSSPTTSTSNTNVSCSLPPLQFGAHSPTRAESDAGGWVKASGNSGNPGKKTSSKSKDMPPPRQLRSNSNPFKVLGSDSIVSLETPSSPGI